MINRFGLFFLYTVIVPVFFGCSRNTLVHVHEKPDSTLNGKELLDYQYAFTEATKQKIFGNIRQSASLFHKCLEAKPSSSAAYYQLGDIYLMMGNPELAVQYTKRAIKLNDANYWYHQQLVRAYQTAGQPDSALIVYKRVTKQHPENERYLYNLALLYMENGEYMESINVLKRVETIRGYNAKLAMQMHELYYKAGKKNKAVELIKEYTNHLPGNRELLLILAVTFEDIGDTSKAELTYKEYIKTFDIDKELFLAYTSFLIKREKVEEVINFMVTYLPADNIPEDIVLQSFLILLESNPTNGFINEILMIFDKLEENNQLTVKYKTIKADFLIRLNRLREAVQLLEEVVEKEKMNPVIWEQILLLYSNIHQWDRMTRIASEAITYFPDQPNFYHLQGYAFTRMGKHNESIDCLEKGIEKCNDKCKRKKFYTILAENYYQTGNFEKSFQYFEKILKIHPNDIETMNNYGFYLARKGVNLERALELSERAVKEKPDSYAYLDTRAWILYKLDKMEDALIYIGKALNNGGKNDAEVLFHYGMILLNSNEKENAMLIFQKVLSMGIEDSDILEQVNQIMNGE